MRADDVIRTPLHPARRHSMQNGHSATPEADSVLSSSIEHKLRGSGGAKLMAYVLFASHNRAAVSGKHTRGAAPGGSGGELDEARVGVGGLR